MHDAQNLFDTKSSYAGEWNVDEIDSLKAQVVGIEHGNEANGGIDSFKNVINMEGKADDYLDL
jgi:alpha-glucosidase